MAVFEKTSKKKVEKIKQDPSRECEGEILCCFAQGVPIGGHSTLNFPSQIPKTPESSERPAAAEAEAKY